MKQALAYAIVQALQSEANTSEDGDGLGVAIDCLSTALKVDLNNDEQKKLYGSVDLEKVFDAGKVALLPEDSVELNPTFIKFLDNVRSKGVFDKVKEGTQEYDLLHQKIVEKFQMKFVDGAAAAKSTTAAASTNEDEAIKVADEFKALGNQAIKEQNYEAAIEQYTKAIEASSTGKNSHIYYCNRAAAYFHLKDAEKCAEDCSAALALDVNYVKAHTRLAQANIALSRYDEAIQNCQTALELEPTSIVAKDTLAQAQQLSGKSTVDTGAGSAAGMPDLSSLAGMMGGAGGAGAGGAAGMPDLSSLAGMMGGAGGAGGGMPDLGSLMSNPALMQAASSMMQNPQMMEMAQNMMSNPDMMQNMMSSLGGANGMPDLSSLAGMMGGMNPPNGEDKK